VSADRQTWARPSVLGVWAHPDDETYLSAALMRRVVRAGGHVTVVTATRGESGAPDPATDRDQLASQREAELRAAMGWVGVTDVRVLDHPDGGCDRAPIDLASQQLVEVIREVRPHLLVTFGPDGITGHPDHVAVNRWATVAWATARKEPGVLPFNAQLLYATMTETFVARHHREYAELPLTLHGEACPTADHDVVLRIEPDAGERRRKRLALDAHASQTVALTELLGADRFHDWWCEETFRHPTAAELGAAFGNNPSPHPLQTGSKHRATGSVTVAA